MWQQMQLEVCVESAAAGLAAVAAGASRIEMNTALHQDGLTADIEDCIRFKSECDAVLVAMVRPHSASFQYSRSDMRQVLESCQRLLAAGVDGIVFGALEASGHVDIAALQAVQDCCGSRPLVYHRAFDLIEDQAEALEQLIEHGVARVLTSGGASSALAGADRLRQLMEKAAGRIEILPGAGVNADNAEEILQLTGCHQLHGSFRATSTEAGLPDVSAIRAVRQILNRFKPELH